jgi:hypothetical protein
MTNNSTLFHKKTFPFSNGCDLHMVCASRIPVLKLSPHVAGLGGGGTFKRWGPRGKYSGH